VNEFPEDIYTEPRTIDVNTLNNLGPLRALAGVWQGTRGLDIKPKADGPKEQAYTDWIELQPLDPQTNGPQLLYGLRYHQHVVKPGQTGTYHDQVGYWLWEPNSGLILQTVAIPRGQVLLASGAGKAGDPSITVTATHGDVRYGICSNDFLEQAFRTDSYRCEITFHDDGGWSYDIRTQLTVKGEQSPFDHHDTNTLSRIAPPTPNPLLAGLKSRA
jgi:hypothetical protein